MNEVIFFTHILIIVFFLLAATKIGKNALIAIICLQGILANIFLYKQINLFGFNTISTDMFIIGSLFGMNLLQEFYGKKEVTLAIRINTFLLFFYLSMSYFQLWYQPNIFDQAHTAYTIILSTMPRIVTASLSVSLIVQFFDAQLYGLLKTITQGKYLIARNTFSLICSQLIDTILFSFLGLYGTVESIQDIIIVSFTIKIITIFSMTPFTALVKILHRNSL